MIDAVALINFAPEYAEAFRAKTDSIEQAVMLCGITAARIAAQGDPNMPPQSPIALLNLLVQGYNTFMAIETQGRVAPPNRGHLGMAG